VVTQAELPGMAIFGISFCCFVSNFVWIPRKFVFIPDGPFDFPKKLAETTGVSALQALADLGRLVLEGDYGSSTVMTPVDR